MLFVIVFLFKKSVNYPKFLLYLGITSTKGIIAAMKDPRTFDGPSAESQQPPQFQSPRFKPPKSQSPHLNWIKKLKGSAIEKVYIKIDKI